MRTFSTIDTDNNQSGKPVDFNDCNLTFFYGFVYLRVGMRGGGCLADIQGHCTDDALVLNIQENDYNYVNTSHLLKCFKNI